VSLPAQPATTASRSRAGAPVAAPGVVAVGFAAFALLGWGSLVVPSLIRDIQAAFRVDDAGMGLAYFGNSIMYVAGSMATAILARHVQRRVLMAVGPALVGLGFVGVGLIDAWPGFLLAYLAVGLGNGILDSGMNALFLDLFPGRAAMLNRLHLFFAIGAFSAPLVAGAIAGAGLPWQSMALGTGLVGVLIGLAMATRALPAHPEHEAAGERAGGAAPGGGGPGGPAPGGEEPGIGGPGAGRVGLWPLVVLGVAIACYVAAELGVSSWLVRYLDEAPVQVATLALSLFWASLGVGRLVISFVIDRVGATRLAAVASVVFGAAVLVAVIAPSLPLVVACFAIAGFAAAPVFPVIMTLGGWIYPGRASTVASVLLSAGLVGSVVYPPLMGVVSEGIGLGVAMAGIAGLAVLCGAGIAVAARLGRGGEERLAA
jgi:fucose permease